MTELPTPPESQPSSHGKEAPLLGVIHKRMQHLYDELKNLQGLAFIDVLLKEMHLELKFEGQGLDRIPAEGPFLVVANHPFGILDGLVLISLIARQRPDFRIVAQAVNEQEHPAREFYLNARLDEFHPDRHAELHGVSTVLRHVREGHPLGIFPSGEVSRFHPQQRKVTDHAWRREVIRLIQFLEVPVIPVHFKGANSVLFQLMSLIHPALSTAAIPSETLKKRNAHLHVSVGSPISPRDYEHLSNTDQLGRYLRARLYALGSNLRVSPFFHLPKPTLSKQQGPRELAAPQPQEDLLAEIQRLGQEHLVCHQQAFEVYQATAREIPTVLQEIGRLRELTFREVGEGTNRARDLDEYDLHYRHLFLWDKEQQQLAGAYRLGLGQEIFLTFGKKGFYTHTLFKMKKGFHPYLRRSIELGRSFILPPYQRQRLSLYLLWKGIYTFLAQHPHYHYLLGPVSISNDYSALSRSFIVAFIQKHYFDEELATLIKARKPFRLQRNKLDIEGLLEGTSNDLKRVDAVISDIEPRHFRLPILLKKYIKQNARILAFNLDPKFNHALDGFMILDVRDLPEATIQGMKR